MKRSLQDTEKDRRQKYLSKLKDLLKVSERKRLLWLRRC